MGCLNRWVPLTRQPPRCENGRENIPRSNRPDSVCCVRRHLLSTLSIEDIGAPRSPLYDHGRRAVLAHNISRSFFVVGRLAVGGGEKGYQFGG